MRKLPAIPLSVAILVIMSGSLARHGAVTAAAATGPFDLGGPPHHESQPEAVNDRGQVVGAISVTFGYAGPYHAFIWSEAAGMVDLGTLGGSNSFALGINARGQVVGTSDIAGDAARHAFVWSPESGMQDLGTLGGANSHTRSINDFGHVAGVSNTATGTRHAFLWTPATGMIDLGTLPGDLNSKAGFINNQGRIAGASGVDYELDEAPLNFERPVRGFSWTAATGMVDIGSLGGVRTGVTGLNARGEITGYSSIAGAHERHAYIWSADRGMVDLGTLGGPPPAFAWARSIAWDISDASQVAGYAFTADDEQHAFSWTAETGLTDIGTLDGHQSFARAVSSNGQVVGDSGGGAFSWTAADGMQALEALSELRPVSLAVEVNAVGLVIGASVDDLGFLRAVVWKVGVTPDQAFASLISAAAGLGFQQGTRLLQNAVGSLRKGNVGPACNQLSAFTNQVRAQTGKSIAPTDASQLLRSTSQLRVTLACP